MENTGQEPIEIDIVTSCNCTTLDWPEGVILYPGDKNKIHAIFDSTEKDKSETVDIDIILRNEDQRNGYPIVYTVQYKFELIQ